MSLTPVNDYVEIRRDQGGDVVFIAARWLQEAAWACTNQIVSVVRKLHKKRTRRCRS